MDRFARIVLGYHGCKKPKSVSFAKRLLANKEVIAEWRPSESDFDWLGHGIYFWEHAPERARRWAGPKGFVIGAVIQLGRCLDQTDVAHTEWLNDAYEDVKRLSDEAGTKLPTNRGRERKARNLDCLVINHLADVMSARHKLQTIRGAFEEGEAAFPGSMIRKETHVQVAVRDTACILGVFLPQLI